MTGIIIATVIVGGVGIFIGLFLGVAGEKFAVEVDEKEVAVRAELPGANCGGCGYTGCDGLAAAIAKGEAPVNGCPVGGDAVGAKIAEIMGVEVDTGTRKVAFVKCAGTCDIAPKNYEYTGAQDCRFVNMMQNGGDKICTFGCLGYGSCVKECPFDAIHIVNGVAVVDTDACKACGKCVAACPKKLIELVPVEGVSYVQCNSHDKGKDVMKACKQGCIGCMKCVKTCEAGAITVEGNVAHIDYEKCTGCGKCKEACPRKIIK
ncbi:MAG: RnfABCDGE type electron transport complex subunit B [Lachnospiraceae bacterium]|nr:RnfABCDGE type electron transport complex subunit B [Lachnospiraceae bacterium]